MRRGIAAVGAMLALALAAGGCTTGHDIVAQANGGGADVVVGTTFFAPGHRAAAPAVTGTLLDRTRYELASDHGHVVVINFWGAWCSSCRVETADLQAVHAATAAAGVRFLGVDIQDSHDAAASYVDAHGVTYPSLFDPPGRTLLGFSAVPPQAIPSTVVIDPAGKIASIHIGSVTHAQLTTMIQRATA
jgi:peroxiredoxin